jgi:hypothetical protein
LSILFALFATVSVAGIPSGQSVEDAVSIDITPEGFAAVTGLLPLFIPQSLTLGTIDAMPSSCWFNAGILVQNLKVALELNEGASQITPRTSGAIDLHLVLDVSLNDPNDPFSLSTDLSCIPETCNGWIESFEVIADTTLHLDMSTDPLTGATFLDAYIDGVTITNGLVGDDIVLQGCAIGWILDTFGLLDLIVGTLDSTIQGALDDAITDLNTTLAATLGPLAGQLTIDEEIDLGDGMIVNLFIEPQDLAVVDDGLHMALVGGMTTPNPHECIARFDPGESLETPSIRPEIGYASPHIDTYLHPDPHHLAAHVRDEFMNQAMYAIWQTGILCQEIGGPGPQLIDLPLSMDTSLLSLLTPGVFDDMFPEAQPILIRLRPEKPPIVNMVPDDIDIEIDDLAIEIYTEIEGRQAKLVDVYLYLDAGLNLSMDVTYGVIGIGIDLEDALSASVNQNEFKPDSDQAVADGIGGLLANPAISGLIGDALGSLGAIGLPPIEFDTTADGFIDTSFGIQDMALTTAGDADDWLGAYMWIGEVDYEYAGCDSGGCGDSGCDIGGCGSTGTGGCDPASSCDMSGCAGGGSTGGCGTTGSTTGPAPASCGVGSVGSTGGCGCTLSGAPGGRVIALIFTGLLIVRRRRED